MLEKFLDRYLQQLIRNNSIAKAICCSCPTTTCWILSMAAGIAGTARMQQLIVLMRDCWQAAQTIAANKYKHRAGRRWTESKSFYKELFRMETVKLH